MLCRLPVFFVRLPIPRLMRFVCICMRRLYSNFYYTPRRSRSRRLDLRSARNCRYLLRRLPVFFVVVTMSFRFVCICMRRLYLRSPCLHHTPRRSHSRRLDLRSTRNCRQLLCRLPLFFVRLPIPRLMCFLCICTRRLYPNFYKTPRRSHSRRLDLRSTRNSR